MNMQEAANNAQSINKPGNTRWWQEPLLHFIALGLLVFALDRLLLGDALDDKQILVDTQLKNELIQQFKTQYRRTPDARELDALLDTWLQNELLYRKGLALGLDKNDPQIRDRVIQKTEFLFKNLASIKQPSDSQLLQWYQSKADNYRKPPSYDFEHVLLRKQYDNAREKAEAVLAQLVSGSDPISYESGYHAFVGRKQIALRVSFGEAFVAELAQLPINQWRLIESNKGWHVLRLQEKKQPPLPSFEHLKPLLRADWHKQQQREQVVRLIDELRDDYIITREQS